MEELKMVLFMVAVIATVLASICWVVVQRVREERARAEKIDELRALVHTARANTGLGQIERIREDCSKFSIAYIEIGTKGDELDALMQQAHINAAGFMLGELRKGGIGHSRSDLCADIFDELASADRYNAAVIGANWAELRDLRKKDLLEQARHRYRLYVLGRQDYYHQPGKRLSRSDAMAVIEQILIRACGELTDLDPSLNADQWEALRFDRAS